MNWPNRISLFRILLIPIILVLMVLPNIGPFFNLWDQGINSSGYHLPYSYLIAGILFIIASLSDMLDGYIARKYNMITTFGKFFDSIADKLLTNLVLIVFGIAQMVPIWMVVVLIARDFIIDVVRQILASANVVMAADKLGKYRAAFEMVGLSILFFASFAFMGGSPNKTGTYDEYGWINQIIMIPMYISTILCIVSAINYMYMNRKALFSTADSPKGK